jgi:hypothetical protein
MKVGFGVRVYVKLEIGSSHIMDVEKVKFYVCALSPSVYSKLIFGAVIVGMGF